MCLACWCSHSSRLLALMWFARWVATASGLPDNLPATTGGEGDGDLPVPVQKASAHARVYDDAGPACVLRYRHTPCCLLWDGKYRHPELGLRRSIPRLRTPCERFATALAGNPRTPRGRCGSLPLPRDGLPPSSFCRSPGAPVHLIKISVGQKVAKAMTAISMR